jgi:sorting nexin-8
MTASRRSRDPPSPNSILDRQALIRALDERNISLKSQHIDAFYQSLHRQHYPPLDKFVETYYLNEAKLSLDDAPTLPLKNKLSRKKNRNKLQLPKVLLDFIKDPNNGFVTITSTVDDARTSADGTTTKLAVKLHDGHLVESVLMRYITKGGSRASLCVSSQVGCAMGCTFCATGTMGIKGNLTTGEILEQIVHADRILAQESVSAKENNSDAKNLDLVRNVVFMGMGEPLNNYDNVVEACRGLIDRKRWNLAHGRVTVSTVGVTPKIHQLTRDLPQVCLALSLHAPNQEMRSAIVPAAKAYKIEGLIDALDRHMMGATSKDYNANGFSKEERIRESTRRRAMIEYVMLEGDTSTFECAHQLGKLCENRHLVVNLIPYNQTDVKDKLRCPSEAHMKEFQSIVASYGAFCTIRRTMGADIASACGQLVVKKEKEETIATNDIEDGPFKSIAEVQVVGRGKENTGDNDDLSEWIRPLSIATSVAASCFVVSTTLFLFQKRKR